MKWFSRLFRKKRSSTRPKNLAAYLQETPEDLVTRIEEHVAQLEDRFPSLEKVMAEGISTREARRRKKRSTSIPAARSSAQGPTKYAIRVVPKETGPAAGEAESLFGDGKSPWLTDSLLEAQKERNLMQDGWGAECDYIVTTYPNGPDIVDNCAHCAAKIEHGAPLPRTAQRDSLDPARVGRPCEGCGRVCCIPCYKRADRKCPSCGEAMVFWYGKRNLAW